MGAIVNAESNTLVQEAFGMFVLSILFIIVATRL